MKSPTLGIVGAFVCASITYAQVLPPRDEGQVVSRLFAATSDGPYVSYSWGEQWFRLRADTRGFRGTLDTFACLGPAVFAGGALGLYDSEDYGETYNELSSFPGSNVTVIRTARLFELEPTLLVGTASALYRSTDRGLDWTRIGGSELTGAVHDLAWPGPQLFVATDGGLFLSDDLGDSWAALGEGLPKAPVLSVVVSRFFIADPTVVVGLEGQGLYRSTDGGESFERAAPELADRTVHAMFWWGSVLLVGADDGLYFSDDGGVSARAVEDVRGRSVLSLSVPAPEGLSQSDILVGTDKGVYKSSDGGFRFARLHSGLGEPRVTAITTFPMPATNRERAR